MSSSSEKIYAFNLSYWTSFKGHSTCIDFVGQQFEIPVVIVIAPYFHTLAVELNPHADDL